MYYLKKICCICLNSKKKLKYLYKYKNLYSKLKLFILSEFLNESSIRKQALVCKKCRNYINEIYIFRKNCIANISLFENYINQLQLYNEPASELSIRLPNITQDNLKICCIKSEDKNEINFDESFEFIKYNEFDSVKIENDYMNSFDESQKDDGFETLEEFGTTLEKSMIRENSTDEDIIKSDINNTQNSEFITPDFIEKTYKSEISSEIMISDFEDTLEDYTLDIIKHEIEETISDEKIPDLEKNRICNSIDNSDTINISSEGEDFVEFTINDQKPNFVTYYFNKLNENENKNNVYNIENNINEKNYKSKCDTYEKLYKKCLHKYTRLHKTQHKCKVCKKIFDSKLELNIHFLLHDKKSNVNNKKINVNSKNLNLTNLKINNICDNYNNEITADDNSKMNNDANNKSIIKTANDYKCIICSKIFSSPTILKQHQQTHLNKYPCYICSKLFLSKFKLTIHSYTHTGIKVHKCEICKKIFISKLKLDKHMKKHLFKCDKCERSFSHECTLKIHCCVTDIA